jgi:hypothetical protein
VGLTLTLIGWQGPDFGWGVEPYYLARREDLPWFDPAIRYGHFDKIDQVRVMAITGWRLALNPSAYLVNDQHHEGGRLHAVHVGGEVRDVETDEGHSNEEELQAARLDASAYYGWWHHLAMMRWQRQAAEVQRLHGRLNRANRKFPWPKVQTFQT